MKVSGLITTTDAEARPKAAVAHFLGPVGIATCVNCGAAYSAAAPAAAPSAGGFGSAAGIYVAADVPAGTAGRAAALGV